MAPTTLIWSFRQKKSKVNSLQAAGNSTGHALTMLALKCYLEVGWTLHLFFFFLMLKYLHLCSCLPRHWILEDADYCLDNAKCPQMPFMTMALDTFQHPSSTRHSFIQKEKELSYCRVFWVFFSLPGVRNLQHLAFRPAKCWTLSSFTWKWSRALLYNPCLAWFNI